MLWHRGSKFRNGKYAKQGIRFTLGRVRVRLTRVRIGVSVRIRVKGRISLKVSFSVTTTIAGWVSMSTRVRVT